MSPVASDMELLGILKILWLYHGLTSCWNNSRKTGNSHQCFPLVNNLLMVWKGSYNPSWFQRQQQSLLYSHYWRLSSLVALAHVDYSRSNTVKTSAVTGVPHSFCSFDSFSLNKKCAVQFRHFSKWNMVTLDIFCWEPFVARSRFIILYLNILDTNTFCTFLLLLLDLRSDSLLRDITQQTFDKFVKLVSHSLWLLAAFEKHIICCRLLVTPLKL